MRKPRDLDMYVSKAAALVFVDELQQMVERGAEGTVYRIKTDLRKWYPSWAAADRKES